MRTLFDAPIVGKAFYCGDNVNTDVISPGRFEPYQSSEHLAGVALIDYEASPPFVDPGTGRSAFTVIFAGHEFGCGSSRETAPQALNYAGARAVIAKSFGRIFFRNCVNTGLLLPIQYDHSFDASVTGKTVRIDFSKLTFCVEDCTYTFSDFGPIGSIIEAGGLINYTKRKLAGGKIS